MEYLLPFNHPLMLNSQYKELLGASTPRILLPVTLALDIVISFTIADDPNTTSK